ncbi:MAG: cation transporter [Gorillibacterium sp.]|nr:cation transporter [Gorillibacterium sp.]
MMPKQRHQFGNLGKTVIFTLLFALIKGTAGWAAGSIVLIVDALHSLSRILAPVARNAIRNTDGKDKAKVAKYEPLAPFLFAAFLLFLGFEALYHAAVVLFTGESSPLMMASRPWAALIAFVFVCICVLSRFVSLKGTQAYAPMLYSGLWPSLLALLGSGALAFAALLGTRLASRLDALAALVTAVLILRTGWRAAIGITPDWSTLEQEHHDTQELIKAAEEVKGVITVKELTACEQGHYVSVSLTLCVNPRITVTEGQEIARALRSHLMERFLHIAEVHVIVLPYDRGYPYNSSVHTGTEYYPPMLQ